MPDNNNSCVNRMINKTQDYDFSIEHKKGDNLITADALSRVYNEDKNNPIEIKEYTSKGTNIKDGKFKKHVFEENKKTYWRFDSGLIREVPLYENKKKIINETHELLKHRGTEACYYEIKKRWYWIGMKKILMMY
ncbi:hypothetical protein COBT_001119 [Conglomerata obtusa]